MELKPSMAVTSKWRNVFATSGDIAWQRVEVDFSGEFIFVGAPFYIGDEHTSL